MILIVYEPNPHHTIAKTCMHDTLSIQEAIEEIAREEGESTDNVFDGCAFYLADRVEVKREITYTPQIGLLNLVQSKD